MKNATSFTEKKLFVKSRRMSKKHSRGRRRSVVNLEPGAIVVILPHTDIMSAIFSAISTRRSYSSSKEISSRRLLRFDVLYTCIILRDGIGSY